MGDEEPKVVPAFLFGKVKVSRVGEERLMVRLGCLPNRFPVFRVKLLEVVQYI